MMFKKKNRGIALVQVLLITGVISILLLSMVKLTQQQLNQAVAIENQISGQLKQTTILNRIQFKILTTESMSEDGWNVYGTPVTYHDYNVRIQDLGSLISLLSNTSYLQKLLVNQGLPEGRAETLSEQIRLWQKDSSESSSFMGSEENEFIPLQHVSELQHIGDWKREDMLLVEGFVHVYPTGLFNPLYVPQEMLEVIVSNNEAEAIMAMREESRYSRQGFSQLTGIQGDEFMPMTRSDFYRIQITGEDGSALEVDVVLRPYDNTPLKTYVTRRALTGQRITYD